MTLIPLTQEGTTYDFTYPNMERKGETYYHYLTTGVTEMYIGTERFLCYGKAKDETGATKSNNGSIIATLPTTPTDRVPANISFGLDPICSSSSADGYSVAEVMATYLTKIAKATGFSTDEAYQTLYKGFINQTGESGATSPIAGSTKNVRKWVELLKKNVANRVGDSGVKAAITNTIGTIDSEIPATEYPGNIGLPDGAAAMKWVATRPEGATDDDYPKFVVVKGKDANTSLSDHSRFVYPAELYYFKESTLKTSTTSQASAYDVDTNTWSQITDRYEDGTVVTTATRSVAIEDAIDYGVCLLEAHITAAASENVSGQTVLKDNHASLNDPTDLVDHDIVFKAESFPLTGIMIGGQYKQKYDFTPMEKGEDEGGTDPEEYIIYDTEVPKGNDAIHLWTSDDEKAKSVYTLVLQTREAKPVDIVLEFENNSDSDFIGAGGGTVYQGTKFYLTGQAWPSTVYGVEEKRRQVFTKDHKTVLYLTVESLKNAYNVIPELRTATHSIRVANVAVRKWTSQLYEEHDFYNW